MAIDYVVVHDCPPKAAFGGAEGLLVRVRVNPGAESLRPHAAACEGCPANLAGRPFGCFGGIDYPFPAAAEEWLMSLPSDPDTTFTGGLLAGRIYDRGLTGAPIAALRDRGKFERDGPVERTWGSGHSERTLDSDHLLHALFADEDGGFSPRDAVVLLAGLNLLKLDGERIEDADGIERAVRIVEDAGSAGEAAGRLDFDLPVHVGRPPPEAAGTLEFLTALFGAAITGRSLAISP